MMVIEITAGWWFNSMALLADGWHMSSHAVAMGLSVFAYAAARRYARDPRFAFGTWKIEVLGVALLMVAGSVESLVSPQPIHYQEAMIVAVAGLAVSILCAMILGGVRGHAHEHDGDHHGHGHDHAHDLNLKAAYLHVVADAATSVLAIVALAGRLAVWLAVARSSDGHRGRRIDRSVGKEPDPRDRQGIARPRDG